MINSVVIVGRLTKDPVQKMTAQGKAVCAFTVAVSRDKDNTEFIGCKAYSRTAELLVQYCKKGSQIGLNGSVHAYTTENNGQKQYHQEVFVNSIEFLSSKAENTVPESEPEIVDISGDDLPF